MAKVEKTGGVDGGPVRPSESAPGELVLLTSLEVARRLSVSKTMVEKLRRAGHLPAIYLGRVPRFRSDDVARLMETGTKRV